MSLATIGLGLLCFAAEPEARTDDDIPLDWPEGKIKVNQPAYGMGVREVNGGAGGQRYRLTPQRWREVVREHPYLSHLDAQSTLRAPGITLLVLGGVHMTISTVLALDGYVATTASWQLLQWGIPAITLVAGAIMTSVGVSAKHRLRREQRRFYLGGYATRRAGGATATFRF